MAEMTIHVRIEMPDVYQSDELYDNTIEMVKERLQELAEGLEGSIEDLEIK